MKLNQPRESRKRPLPATEVLHHPEQGFDFNFDIEIELDAKKKEVLHRVMRQTSLQQSKWTRAFQLAVVFPEDRGEARNLMPRFPLQNAELQDFLRWPFPHLYLFPERRKELINLLGGAERVLQQALTEKNDQPNALLVAYLFVPEHTEKLGALRARGIECLNNRFSKLETLAWLKVCDPTFFETLLVDPRFLDKEKKSFNEALQADLALDVSDNTNHFVSLGRAFALHVLAGGSAKMTEQGVVVDPKPKKVQPKATLPDRVTV